MKTASKKVPAGKPAAAKAPAKVVAEKAGGLIDQSRYESTKFTDPATGKSKTSKGTGDAIAIAMLHIGTNDSALKAVAKANGFGDFDPSKYPNNGMARMTLGNKLRARVIRIEKGSKDDEPVEIGEFTIKRRDQKVPLPKAA